MVIRSKWKDFYDSALGYGHDDARTFVRESSFIAPPMNAWPYGTDVLELLKTVPTSHFHKRGLLLFCGRVFPVWHRYDLWRTRDDVLYFHDDGEAVHAAVRPEWVRYHRGLGALESIYRSTAYDAPFFAGDDLRGLIVPDRTMAATHDRLAGVRFGEDVLVSLGMPYALVLGDGEEARGRVVVVTSPPLAPMGFQREMDAFAAYQAIETFLGSRLAPPDIAPQRVGSDEVLAAQKGFGPESFRTVAPGAKKAARAVNRSRKRGDR